MRIRYSSALNTSSSLKTGFTNLSFGFIYASLLMGGFSASRYMQLLQYFRYLSCPNFVLYEGVVFSMLIADKAIKLSVIIVVHNIKFFPLDKIINSADFYCQYSIYKILFPFLRRQMTIFISFSSFINQVLKGQNLFFYE